MLSIHPSALCESETVGAGTRIGAFAHIQPGARIGRDCEIGPHVLIENGAVLGDRVTVKAGVQLWDGVQLEHEVFVGPNATFTNARLPRADGAEALRTVVHHRAAIGANATILPGLEIGANAVVGAGAVVTRSIPPNAIVAGNPARISGYANAMRPPTTAPFAGTAPKPGVVPLGVGRASLHELALVKDLRGALTVGEFEQHVPFRPRRYFVVFDVPSREARGEHAHKVCDQFLICVRGSCYVLLDDGRNRREVRLDRPDLGVYMPAMIWGTQYKYSPDGVMLVFASDPYDPSDYIRTYDEYLERLASDPPGLGQG
jgi:acetyltransferase-like isoleucine patch superfamily enzyme